MRVGRAHPTLGWLRLAGADYAIALDRLLLERDRDSDQQRTGPAPAFRAWVWDEQMPALAQKDGYRVQIEARRSELQAKRSALSTQIQKATADLTAEVAAVDLELAHLEGVLP